MVFRPSVPSLIKNKTKKIFSELEEKAGCSAIIVLQMCCYYKCSAALPLAVGLSAVCDCEFLDHTHLVLDLL